MDISFGLILLIGALLILKFVFSDELKKQNPADQHQKADPYSDTQANEARYEALPLLSESELSFFRVLKQILTPDYYILSKVRVADIIRPVRVLSRSGRTAAFNSIARKHVDFVICEPSEMKVVAILELDGRSHGTLEQGIRDLNKNRYFENTGIPLIRIQVSKFYTPIKVREEIEKNIQMEQSHQRAA